MPEHHHHQDGDHSHGSHEPVVHAPPPDPMVAYNAAFDAALPDETHRVVEYDIEAREMDWEFMPGRRRSLTSRRWRASKLRPTARSRHETGRFCIPCVHSGVVIASQIAGTTCG